MRNFKTKLFYELIHFEKFYEPVPVCLLFFLQIYDPIKTLNKSEFL